ncbi:hypothetical protein M0805_003111 [Coniferiporia weirii]|nr:hypothetical protein M0805_003111 [Coniferiporia weirii]
MPVNRSEVLDTQGSEEAYLGAFFDGPETGAYEAIKRVSPSPLSTPNIKGAQVPKDTQRAYAHLLAQSRQQQQELTRLRTAGMERSRSSDGLGADLLAMTHRYLQAQAHADSLERRRGEAQARAESLAAQLEDEKRKREALQASFRRLEEENRALRVRCEVREQSQSQERQERHKEREQDSMYDRTDTSTLASTSSEYVAMERRPSLIRTQTSPEELIKLIRTSKMQSLEVARACIASSTFRAGVKVPQVDNKMIVNVTEGIGCVLVQMLRSKDHSKDKSMVELCIQTLLAYHVYKIVENWPFHLQLEDDKSSIGSRRDSDTQSEERGNFSKGVDNVLTNVVTILSLCGSPGQISALKRNHEARIGSTIDALIKTSEQIASHVKGGAIGTSALSSAEYKILYAKPGSAFNKDIMQRQGPQTTMAKWNMSSSKKNVQVLCTRELGLAWLHRSASVGVADQNSLSLSRADSHGSRGSGSKELEVLSKAIIVFESELDK